MCLSSYAITDLGSRGGVGALGTTYSRANGMNAYGQVVGESTRQGASDVGDYLAFLWQKGKGGMNDLNSLIPSGSGWTLVDAKGINLEVQIVGNGTISNQHHAYLLVPTASTNNLTRSSSPNTSPAPAGDTVTNTLLVIPPSQDTRISFVTKIGIEASHHKTALSPHHPSV